MKFTIRLAPLFFLSVLHAQAITVTNTDDSGPGSLRQALVDASPADNTITFAAGLNGQTLNLSTAQLVISSDLSIDASALADGFTINANASENDRRRVLLIESDLTVSLTNLTITGGWTADGIDGVNGEDGTRSEGGGGIALRSGINLTITSSTVSNNRTGDGGRGGDNVSNDGETIGGDGGNAGSGGGVFVGGDSQLNIFSTTISDNEIGNGGDGGNSTFGIGGRGGNGGTGAFLSGGGGGIYLRDNNQLIMESSVVSGNQAGNGGSSGSGAEEDGFGGIGGGGGGICSEEGNLITLTSCLIFNNQTGSGGSGFRGSGGGIYSLFDAEFTLLSCSISNNRTGDESNDENSTRGGFGGGIYTFASQQMLISSSSVHGNLTGNRGNGDGGGIYSGSPLTITSSTISSNQTGNTQEGFRSGRGGGIYTVRETLTITSSAVVANQTGNSENPFIGDGGGIFSGGSPVIVKSSTITANSGASAGGIFNRVSNYFLMSSIENSIITGNSPSNIEGDPVTELGSNILSGDPLLAPLGDYGGPTQTMPPLPGSPAIDAGGSFDPGGNDQRELPRFVNGALDIGAVELQAGEVFLPFLAAEWALDNDQDGTPNGIESIIGRNPLVPDSGSSRDLAFTLDDSGDLNLRFGKNDTLPQGITLRLLRSTTLTDGSFELIGTYNTTSNLTETSGNDLDDSFTVETDEFSFIDADQPAGRAFYRIEADIDQP